MSTRIRLAAKRVAGMSDRLRPPRRGLVVLAYHRVGRRTGIEVDLPTSVFETQMASLAEDRKVMELGEGADCLEAGEDLTGRVVVTFDDGTADFADTVLPVLECYQVPVTIYVATAHVDEGRPFPDDGRPLSWAALADCVATGLVRVGSHTHTHRLMDRLAPAAAADELDRSIGLIEQHLQVAVTDFAYPKAVAPRPAVELEVRRRFRTAALAGTRPNPPLSDLWRLARSPVQHSDGMVWFDAKTGGGMALEDDLRQLLNRRRYAGLTR